MENQLREKQKQIKHAIDHHIISMIYTLTDHFSPQPITGQAITSKIGMQSFRGAFIFELSSILLRD